MLYKFLFYYSGKTQWFPLPRLTNFNSLYSGEWPKHSFAEIFPFFSFLQKHQRNRMFSPRLCWVLTAIKPRKKGFETRPMPGKLTQNNITHPLITISSIIFLFDVIFRSEPSWWIVLLLGQTLSNKYVHRKKISIRFRSRARRKKITWIPACPLEKQLRSSCILLPHGHSCSPSLLAQQETLLVPHYNCSSLHWSRPKRLAPTARLQWDRVFVVFPWLLNF